MAETKTISLNQNYISHEFPSRVCLVCGKLEKEEAKVVFTGDAWLCGRCKSTLLKLIEDANTSNALNALEQENKEGKEEVTNRNVGKWIPVISAEEGE